jgi:hypothetical protein
MCFRMLINATFSVELPMGVLFRVLLCGLQYWLQFLCLIAHCIIVTCPLKAEPIRHSDQLITASTIAHTTEGRCSLCGRN